VFGVVAVGEVQAHDVHAGIQHLAQHFFGFGLGTDGADDLVFFMSVFMVKEFPPCNIHQFLDTFMIQKQRFERKRPQFER
jgi:hypothetical protein